LAKIQILEEALITLLQKASHDIIAKEERFHGETLKNMNDFVKLYRREIIHHFKVEELVLFPVLRNIPKDEDSPVGRL